MKKMFPLLTALTLSVTSLIAAPQAVVFDFGGVMAGEDVEAVVRFIRESLHLSKEEFEKANQQKRLALQQGQTHAEFWIGLAKTKGIKLPKNWGETLYAVMKDTIKVNSQMYVLVDQLREKKMSVALFSNVDEHRAAFIRNYGWYEPFNPCVLSCDIGVNKPDPKAYAILLQKLKLPAKDVVFIDDREDNVQAAKELGIDAILFKSEEQVRDELHQRGVL